MRLVLYTAVSFSAPEIRSLIVDASHALSNGRMTSYSTTPQPPLPALDDTLGAWLVGALLAALLQGVIYHQTYEYFQHYPKDPRYLKIWIFVLHIVEATTTILTIHICYYLLVANYLNPQVFVQTPVWSLKLIAVPGSLTAVITQLFFARRVYKLKKRYRPVAFICAILLISFLACYIAMPAIGWNAPNFTAYLNHSWLLSTGTMMLVAADTIMTSILIYFLRTNRTGVSRTDTMLDLIIMYAVSSGLIICVLNALAVIFSLVWPHKFIFCGIIIVLTKVYSITFLVTLNARQSLLNRGVVMEATTVFTSAVVGNRAIHPLPQPHVEVPLEIHQHVSSFKVTDGLSAIELRTVKSHTLNKATVQYDREV
ncbi:hypothetical protein C8Q74DRAFT_971553 [Fomes fomentarius]|nr:hypothetical protein C8Q74DRAFT_971553 [Fomes fomentarius]